MKKDHGSESFFCYTPTTPGSPDRIAGVASGGSGNGQIVMNDDSDFVWLVGTFSAISNNADVTASCLATVQITDTSDNTSIFISNQPLRNVFGTAQLPFWLPRPITFAAKTTLNVVVYNLNSANPVDFFLTLAGVKQYT
ncbi:MAG: hypothetical protein OSA97_01465 [Nevskia sp.]|nr:hypothetical protein [Nevskia sp.]